MLDGRDFAPTRERVAVISHAHPSVSKGGAEIAAYTLFRGLQEIGVPSVFVAAVPERIRDQLVLDDPGERAVFYDEARYDHFHQLGTPGVAAELERVLLAEGVTAASFHHYLNFGLGAVRAAAARDHLLVSLTLHEFLAICHHHGQMVTRPARSLCEMASPQRCNACFPDRDRLQFAARRSVILEALDGVAGFVAPSRFLAGRYAEWGLPADRIRVVENGLREHVGHAAAPTSAAPAGAAAGTRRRHEGAPWVFSFFGQITPFKGVDVLLDAAELIAADPALRGRVEIRLHGTLVGQPDSFVQQLHEAVERHRFLHYAGPYENATVGRLMGASDYVLVPSTWWENSPVVIQEAYAAGCPVICSAIGGMAEKVLDGRTGLHFLPGDASSLTRAIAAAADPVRHLELLGLPTPLTAAEMAREYLDAFEAFRTARPAAQREAAAAPCPTAEAPEQAMGAAPRPAVGAKSKERPRREARKERA